GLFVMICAVACSPSTCGILMSMVMTSGLRDSESVIASRPSLAWPTTCNWSSELKIDSRTFRMKAESSTTSTRNFFCALLVMARLSNWHDWPCRLRPNQLFHCEQQLVFLHWLCQE